MFQVAQHLNYLPPAPEAYELFKAETEEELKKIESMGVKVMEQAINAYRNITATDEFKEIERQCHYAAHNKASVIGHAVDMEREKWQGVVCFTIFLTNYPLFNMFFN